MLLLNLFLEAIRIIEEYSKTSYVTLKPGRRRGSGYGRNSKTSYVTLKRYPFGRELPISSNSKTSYVTLKRFNKPILGVDRIHSKTSYVTLKRLRRLWKGWLETNSKTSYVTLKLQNIEKDRKKEEIQKHLMLLLNDGVPAVPHYTTTHSKTSYVTLKL